MFNRDNYNLNMLPIEALLVIFSYLSPEKLSAMTLVNKKFSISAKDNLFWNMKFSRHFPHLYEAVSTQDSINWYAEFCVAYDYDYEFLPTATRKLFSLAKEDDIVSIKNLKLKFSDLCAHDNASDLINWAVQNGKQKLLDCFYEIVLDEYTLQHTIDTVKADSRGSTILHWAIYCHQNVGTIAAIILQGTGINQAMNNGATPLYVAALHNRLDVIQYLLAHGADLCKTCENGETALHIAARYGHLEIIKYLLTKFFDDDALMRGKETLLRLAANFGHLEVVQYFLNLGVNINYLAIQQTPLYLAASNGHIEIVKYLLPNYKGDELIGVLINLPKEYQANFLMSFGIEAFIPYIKDDLYLKIMIECFPENYRASILEQFESESLIFLLKGDKLRLILILLMFNVSDRSGILKIMGNDVLKSVINKTDDLLHILINLPEEHWVDFFDLMPEANGTLATSPHNLFAYRETEPSLPEEKEEQPGHGPT